jgi:DNA-binding GntR family transcriptional regulator
VEVPVAKRSEASYQLVARELRARIRQGDFDDGGRLPTEAELSAAYGVSRQTVRRAFQDLVADEMVYRVPGRGTFAQPASDGYVRQVGSVDDLMGLSDDTVMEIVKPLVRRVDLVSAGRLRQLSDVIYELRFVRIHDAERFCLTKVFLPTHVGKELLNVEEVTTMGATSTLTIIGLLDARLPNPIAEAQQSITVESVKGSDATDLGCDEGHPTLRIDRLYLDTNEQCVELATSYFLPEQYSYRISLRRN